jgi:hypothetical protein
MALEIIPRLPFHVVPGVVHAGQCGRGCRPGSRRLQTRQVSLQIVAGRRRKIGGKPDQRLLHGVERLGLRHRGRCRGRCIGSLSHQPRLAQLIVISTAKGVPGTARSDAVRVLSTMRSPIHQSPAGSGQLGSKDGTTPQIHISPGKRRISGRTPICFSHPPSEYMSL